MAREERRPRASAPPQITIERELFLRGITGARPQGHAAQQLARAMSDASFRAGETIYRVGDFTRLIHFVTHGNVELSAAGVDAWRLAAPAVIGALDVNQRQPFSRTATAITDVRALVLHEDDWMEALEDHIDFARETIFRVASDVHQLHLTSERGGGFPEPPKIAHDDEPHALNLQERTLALRAVSCFKGAVVQALALLAAAADERALVRRERLFSRGDPARSIFVVARGIVRIERESPVIRARFGPGSIVGGGSAISLVAHDYTAEAETQAVVLEIRRDGLIDALEDHREMIRAMFAGLGREREEIMNDRARAAKLAIG